MTRRLSQNFWSNLTFDIDDMIMLYMLYLAFIFSFFGTLRLDLVISRSK